MRLIGLTSLLLGAVSGGILGLWSFDGPVRPPELLQDYTAVGRRLMRLGHIAFFGLGILNLVLARELSVLRLSPISRRVLALAMIGGNVLMPAGLFVAALYPAFKFFLPVPSIAVVLGLGIAAWGGWSQFRIGQGRGSISIGEKTFATHIKGEDP